MVSALCQHPHSSLGHGVDFGGTDFELVPETYNGTQSHKTNRVEIRPRNKED